MSSIPPESPWRGAAAFLPQPVNEADILAAQNLVETIYYYNVRYPITRPLPDIEYRSSYRERDVLRHVFRWDRAPYDYVFQNGFHARRQERTTDLTYYNLARYVNHGGRPLDIRRTTTYTFVSTARLSSWHPRLYPGRVERVYRYEIYAPGGIHVAQTLGDRYRWRSQHEISFPAGIAPQYIRSAQLFELRGYRGYTRRRRVNTTLYINTNFNPQAYPQRALRLQRPVCDYLDENRQRWRLAIQEFPEQRRQKREVSGNDDDITDYYVDGITKLDTYIDAAFRGTSKNEAYMFIKKEYVRIDYAPASTNDKILNGPLFISNGFPCLMGTAFAEYGIDAAFGYYGVDEAFLFSGKLCAKMKYSPGTTVSEILEGPKTIKQMFPFFNNTAFENGVDAAFESTVDGEAYLFKGSQYALINYSQRYLIAIRLITEGFLCLKNTIFESDIESAFASHKSNEAYLFKGNKYVLLHFTPGKTKDYIIGGGPKDITPNNFPSLKDILPRKNRALDIYDEDAQPDPDCDQDDLD